MLIALDGTNAAVDIADCTDLKAAFDAATSRWTHRHVASADWVVSTVEKLGPGLYRVTGEDGLSVDAPATGAVCAALVDVAEAMMDESPERLFLHGGGVAFSGRLVIFPSRSHAGKSTLVTRLAASGHRVFGDDILPISVDDQAGIAVGMPPRIRLPLPAAATDAFRRFVDASITSADHRYAFVQPPEGAHAWRGEKCPLGAIVLLDRREAGRAELGRAMEGDILRTLVSQNMALGTQSAELLTRLHALMERLPSLVLRYRDLEDAAELLERVFAAWPPVHGDLEAFPLPQQALEQVPAEAEAAFVRSHPYRHADGVDLKTVGAEIFIAGSQSNIYALNEVGAAIWSLMDEPISADEAAALLREAFPGADSHIIAADVAALFSALIAGGFIVHA